MDVSAEDSEARGVREALADAIPAHLIGALEAELTEHGEWLARLEARLAEVERRLPESGADLGAAAPEVPAEHAERGKRVIREIGAGPWTESAEWSYLLRRCEGFRVCDSSGLLGVVESVRFENDLDLPETLVVGTGGPGRRRHVEIAVSEVANVDPEQQQVKLAVPARAWLFPVSSRRLRRRLPPVAPNP
jgi:hypothetical protein